MDLENVIQHSLPSKLRGPLAFKRNASTAALKKMPSILISQKMPSAVEGNETS